VCDKNENKMQTIQNDVNSALADVQVGFSCFPCYRKREKRSYRPSQL